MRGQDYGTLERKRTELQEKVGEKERQRDEAEREARGLRERMAEVTGRAEAAEVHRPSYLACLAVVPCVG